MSDNDFAAHLDQLQQILGQSCSIREPRELARDAPEQESKDEPSWEAWQTKGEASIQTGFLCFEGLPAEQDGGSCSSLPRAAPSAGADFDCSSLRVGGTIGQEVEFCPWKTILAYPTNFIGKANRPRARPFFDSILVGRTWDLWVDFTALFAPANMGSFYLHEPKCPRQRPHFMVPTAQFEDFLGEVNQALGIALTLPPGVNRHRFCLKFGRGGTPQPRLLLRSHDETDLELEAWPGILDSDLLGFKKASKVEQDTFVRTLATIAMSNSQLDKRRKAQERANRRAMERRSMMNQTQAYLGLHKGNNGGGVIFVCIDVEAIELAPNPVSEVGIAILDTNRIRCGPGPGGWDWWQFIEAHHLRTREYSHLRNHQYVAGCPDKFNFGVSTFPGKRELAVAVMSTLEPFVDGYNGIVFVAHDTKQDVRYLSKIGVDILNLPGLLGSVDTVLLHQAWSDSSNMGSLRTVLSDLGIPSKNLHNAGNDAVYTLRAMMGLAVEQLRKDRASEAGEQDVPALDEEDGQYLDLDPQS